MLEDIAPTDSEDEEAAIARNGRISNGCLGLWEDGQVEALAPIVAFMKSQGATTALQINHGGRKSSTQRAWEGNSLLTEENLANGDEKWQPVGASATPFSEGWPAPTPLDEAGLQGIRDGFVASAHARASRFLSPPDNPRNVTPPGSTPPMGLRVASTGSPTSRRTDRTRHIRTASPRRSRPSFRSA